MLRRYYYIINLIFLIAIPTWLALIASLLGAGINAAWSLSSNAIPNSIFLLASTVILWIIGFMLLKKFKSNNKDSALLLATYNFLYGTSSFLEALGNYVDFYSEFNQAMENLVFVIISWAMIFFFLFLQDIFTGSFIFKNHKKSHSIFLTMMLSGLVSLVINATGLGGDVFSYIGFACFGIVLITLCCWQISAALKLVKKATEQGTKNGLMMIAISGVIFIAVLISVVLKSLTTIAFIDILIPILVFSASIFTYLGYIYPSKHASRPNK